MNQDCIANDSKPMQTVGLNGPNPICARLNGLDFTWKFEDSVDVPMFVENVPSHLLLAVVLTFEQSNPP